MCIFAAIPLPCNINGYCVARGFCVYTRRFLHTRRQLRDELHSLRPYATEPYQTKFAIEELVAAKTK